MRMSSEKCLHILLSPKEFEAHQHTLAAVKRTIQSHWRKWNEGDLTNTGFLVIDKPAIVAVAETDGRFAIQFVLLPNMPCEHAMANLANNVFDECSAVQPARKTIGQTNVNTLCDKRCSGTKLMYGIKCQPHNRKYAQAHGLCCTLCPCLYNLGTPRDADLEELWQTHPTHFANLEASHVPAVAKRRAEIADEVDPTTSHRLSPHCNAFAFAYPPISSLIP